MSLKAILCAALGMCSLGYIARPASAQVLIAPVAATPVVVQPAPVVVTSNYATGYSSYVAPTYSSLSPIVTTSTYSTLSPVVTTPTYSTLSPVVTTTPVVAYRPVVTSYAVPYVTSPAVIVSPRGYVPGEPVRNFFRAVAPY